MKFWRAWFNTYLAAAIFAGATLVLLAGCETTEAKKRAKEASTLRLHVEVNPDGTTHTMRVPVFREQPVMVSLYREPFLTEADILEAAVIESMGGFAIKLQFNRHGTWVLENITTANRGRRIAIQSHFGETRWLGAPLISRRISTGVFVFTPDATRDEAERIVRGLNNLARELRKKG